jgi:hypothetical protein
MGSPFYKVIQEIAALRTKEPTLRYGRQYFREISGDGKEFGYSTYKGGILAFSRILDNTEICIVINSSTENGWEGHVIVDFPINPKGDGWKILYSNHGNLATLPSATIEHPGKSIKISDAVMTDPTRSVKVKLKAMEVQILGKAVIVQPIPSAKPHFTIRTGLERQL